MSAPRQHTISHPTEDAEASLPAIAQLTAEVAKLKLQLDETNKKLQKSDGSTSSSSSAPVPHKPSSLFPLLDTQAWDKIEALIDANQITSQQLQEKRSFALKADYLAYNDALKTYVVPESTVFLEIMTANSGWNSNSDRTGMVPKQLRVVQKLIMQNLIPADALDNKIECRDSYSFYNITVGTLAHILTMWTYLTNDEEDGYQARALVLREILADLFKKIPLTPDALYVEVHGIPESFFVTRKFGDFVKRRSLALLKTHSDSALDSAIENKNGELIYGGDLLCALASLA